MRFESVKASRSPHNRAPFACRSWCVQVLVRKALFASRPCRKIQRTRTGSSAWRRKQGAVKQAVGKAVADAKLEADGRADKQGKFHRAIGGHNETLNGKSPSVPPKTVKPRRGGALPEAICSLGARQKQPRTPHSHQALSNKARSVARKQDGDCGSTQNKSPTLAEAGLLRSHEQRSWEGNVFEGVRTMATGLK
jgi:uncharacterized protein YjbJ (UPF0337 family)